MWSTSEWFFLTPANSVKPAVLHHFWSYRVTYCTLFPGAPSPCLLVFEHKGLPELLHCTFEPLQTSTSFSSRLFGRKGHEGWSVMGPVKKKKESLETLLNNPQGGTVTGPQWPPSGVPGLRRKTIKKLFGLALMFRIDKTESRCVQTEKSKSFVISMQHGKSGAVLNASLLPSGVGKRKWSWRRLFFGQIR